MNLDLEIEFSKADILKEVDQLKQRIDALKPLPPDVEGRVMQKLRLDWNYNSNAIEGNKLNYGETVAFLMTGITAKGKPLKDHLDIRGHNEAINFLMSIVKDTRPLTEADIRALHEMILVEPYEVKAQTADGTPTSKRINLGEYKTSPNHVQTATGETHYYISPEETPLKMRELLEWYEETDSHKEIHPVVIAALFHHKFVEIHPFDDGNGRLSRILMNLILMKNGYPPAIVKMDDRQNYYALLSQADVNDSWPFVEYIAERLEASLQLYLKAAKGEDIDEDEDIDKEIALFKMQIKEEVTTNERKSIASVIRVFNEEILQIVELVMAKGKQFEDVFFESKKGFSFFSDEVFDFDKKKLKMIGVRTLNINDFDSVIYDEVEFEYTFKGFKNRKNAFEVNLFFGVLFKEYSYIITDFNLDEITTKEYNEHVFPNEKQIIVKSFVKAAISKIQSSINKKADI